MKKVNKKTSLEMQSDCGKSIEYIALYFNSKHKFTSNLLSPRIFLSQSTAKYGIF
jgi:hypothetical protein